MRKGISQIVSSALLIAIAVSIAGVYANWAPDFSKDTAGEVADQTNNDLKCRNAGVDISDPVYYRSADRISMDLRNTGTISFYNDLTVYLLNQSSIIDQTSIEELEVDEERTIEIENPEIPGRIIVSSQECPGLEISESRIEVN